MVLTESIFFQFSFLLAMTVSIAMLVRALKQPLIIAYIVAGIVAGPMFFNLLHGKSEIYEIFANFGIVLLLFVIGLHLDLKYLKKIGKVALFAGLGQVIFTSVMGFFILLGLGFDTASSIYLSIAVTFSSTIVIMKLLGDKGDTETIYGKYTIGLMIVQDILAVIILIAIGVFAGKGEISLDLLGLLTAKGLFLAMFMVLASKYFLPWILNKISNSSELLFIFTLAWCFSLASMFSLFGFSLEMGAIFAGIALSSSPYQIEIGSRIRPLRDFFLILFFIVLGSEMGIGSFGKIWFPALILSIFILVGNSVILYFIFRFFKFTRKNSFLAGITAAQVSEFGFVILFTGKQAGYFENELVQIFTLVAITTIFISSYLIVYSKKVYRLLIPIFNLFGKDGYHQLESRKNKFDVWVVGHHRIGSGVCKALKDSEVKFSVIDHNSQAIKELKKMKIKAVFGDISDIEFLEALNISNSNLIIMTIPSAEDQFNLINFVKKNNPKTMIIANAYQKDDVESMYEAGADFVMMPHLIGERWISDLLRGKKLSKKILNNFKEQQAVDLCD